MNNATDTQLSSKSRVAQKIILAASFIGIVTGFVFTWDKLGIQYPLFISASLTIFFGFVLYTQRHVPAFAGLSFILAIVLSMTVAIRDAPSLHFFSVVSSLALINIGVMQTMQYRMLQPIDYVVSQWLLPLTAIGKINVLVLALQHNSKKTSRTQSALRSQVLRGVIIALPLLAIFAILFASADAVFGRILASIFDISIDVSAEFVTRAVFSFIVFVVSAAMLSFVFLRSVADGSSEASSNSRNFPVELSIVLGSLNLLFAIFLAIQAVYLFGGNSVVLDGELTYAEYGRRGFFELLAVATLVFGVVYAARKYYDRTKTKYIEWLLLGLITQVGIIMISALRRLELYEEVFGFTILRFYSHSFVFFLALAFSFLVIAIVLGRKDAWIARSVCVLFASYMLALNIANPHQFIARQNLERYEQTGKLDAYYVTNLSADAATYGIEAARIASEENEWNQPEYCRDHKVQYWEQGHWSTWNASRAHAARVCESSQ